MRPLRPPDVARAHMGRVYALALGITRNEKDAEDIAQNALIKVVKNLPRFRGESRLSTWIYRIAYNEALMYLRKRKARPETAVPPEELARTASRLFRPSAPRPPDRALLAEELRSRMEGAIARMPIQYRMPLLLHYMHDLPLREVSEVLGVTAGSVKTRMHRAYLMLREDMEKYRRDMPEGGSREDERCGRWMRLLVDYATSKLEQGKGGEFKDHIADCPGCSLFLERYLKALRITGALQCRDIPPELRRKAESFLR